MIVRKRSTFKKKRDAILDEDPLEVSMKLKHDKLDEEKAAQAKIYRDRITNASNFSRLLRLSEPKINIFIGMIVSVGQGSLLPIFGIFMGKMLFVLQWLPFINDYPKIRADSNFYCLMMLILAIVSFGTATTQKFSFGYIGENVTMKIRKQLYSKILSKHMGWFDEKENTPGVLSATMASDA